MDQLIRQALTKAHQIRKASKLDMYQPMNIFDFCCELGLTVRFLDINMEGMYVSTNDGASPQIILSNQRPLSRRCYTCAHELGHHVFNHGSKIDQLSDDQGQTAKYDRDEFLVDVFAGALLMPIAGIQSEFAKRDWNINNGTPIQFYTICSIFGTGYKSLIVHCKANKIISGAFGQSLLKYTPKKIGENILGHGANISHFKIIDKINHLIPIDLEVTNLIFLPADFLLDGDNLKKENETEFGTVYKAMKPGICRVISADGFESCFIRIQNSSYVGLSEFRHLENEEI